MPTLLVGPPHGELAWQLQPASVPEPAARGASDGFRNFLFRRAWGRATQTPSWPGALRVGMVGEEGEGDKVPEQKRLLRGQRKQLHW